MAHYSPFRCLIIVSTSSMEECERFLTENLCRPKRRAYNRNIAFFTAIVTPEERTIMKLIFDNITIEDDHLGKYAFMEDR